MKKRINETYNSLGRTRTSLGRDFENGLRLDRNEKVEPHTKEFCDALVGCLDLQNIGAYPEVENLYEKLAKWVGVDSKELFLTDGSDGGIKLAIEMLSRDGDGVVVPVPTFAMYEVYASMYNRNFIPIQYSTSDYSLDMQSMYDSIDDNCAIVFLPNPNQPLDSVMPLGEIEKLAQKCLAHNAFLIIDEAYYLFSDTTAVELVKKYDNVLVLRTFSKAFGMAGIRLGYVVGNEENIKYLEKTRRMIETNSLSVRCAEFILDNMHFIYDDLKIIRNGQKYIQNELNKMGLKWVGENANFVFIDFGSEEEKLNIIKFLHGRKIYIRGGFQFPWNSFARVTVGNDSTMAIFMDNLKEYYINKR